MRPGGGSSGGGAPPPPSPTPLVAMGSTSHRPSPPPVEAASPYFASLPATALPLVKPAGPGPLARWLARQARQLRALSQPPDASNLRAASHHDEAELRRLLSPLTYALMRQQQTEAPFSGKCDALDPEEGYIQFAACSWPLYWARAKLSSGCGWPAYVPASLMSLVVFSFSLWLTGHTR